MKNKQNAKYVITGLAVAFTWILTSALLHWAIRVRQHGGTSSSSIAQTAERPEASLAIGPVTQHGSRMTKEEILKLANRAAPLWGGSYQESFKDGTWTVWSPTIHGDGGGTVVKIRDSDGKIMGVGQML